ncbi:MAG TPA: hypothetical protein VIV12_31710 [Streptosporangiaceae bacterium]
MNGGNASYRGRPRARRPGLAQGGSRRRGGYRPADPRRSRGLRAAAALAAVVTIASGYLFVKAEKAPPGPPAPPPVSLGPVSWPAAGVSAADISGIGVVAGPGADQMVPIASVAKVMTAYVILRDHPLSAGGRGPDIVVQSREAAAYPALVRDGDSLVPVAAGERISKRQALAALLLPSADNTAWILARWDVGSEAAFVARMNNTARRLG